VGDSHERCTSHDFDKEHVKYIVHRIPNRVEPASPIEKQSENVPCGGGDSCQGELAVPVSIGKAHGWKDWIGATIYELDRLTSTLETIVLGRSLQDYVALVLWSVTSRRADSKSRVALSPRLRSAVTLVGG
jgi:hypothetical protein